jgi:serine/threonine protein kinase
MSHDKLSELIYPEDPTTIFELLEEIAVGSFGSVYKVCVFGLLENPFIFSKEKNHSKIYLLNLFWITLNLFSNPTFFFQGKHLPTGEIVAVKICALEDDDSLADLLLEIEILKKCNHPNIVRFFGAYQKGEEIYVRNKYFLSFIMNEKKKLTSSL